MIYASFIGLLVLRFVTEILVLRLAVNYGEYSK